MTSNNPSRRPIVVLEAPAHPVPELQGPFEESMFESQKGLVEEVDVPLDADGRRNMLLEAPTYERVIAGRWKQKHGENFHPLSKLVAQMSFGIHLLAENMAKSEDDVFQILQTHVDDVDIFLERTTEDFTLAQEDIHERLECLKLPLQHPDVFDRMLEDRAFRNSIVDGNEKIEHIVYRTGCAIKDALKDVQKGSYSTNVLEKYLYDLEITWLRGTPEHEAVFVAMLGNVEGWKRALLDLYMQGNKLLGSLRKLADVINQMQQRAGEVSRRLIRQQQSQGGSINSSSNITYISQQQNTSRSSSRQQTTPSPMGTRKPLPAPTSRPTTKHHSRSRSRDSPHDQRAGTSQSSRSGTALSAASGSARSETPNSRTQSRSETIAPSVPDSDQRRMNIRAPRIVHVKNHQPHHRADSQSASVRQYPIHQQPIAEESRSATPTEVQHNRPYVPRLQIRKQQSNASEINQPQLKKPESRNFVPVELPAELPPSAFLQAPMSNTNRLSAGLGILPSERRAQAQSRAFNPTTALIELLSDPSRFSKLPLTPNSAHSPGATLAALEGQKRIVAQAQQAALREPTPDQTPPKPNEGGRGESVPNTPAWATRPFNVAEHNRVLTEKIPLTSHVSEGTVITTGAPNPVLKYLSRSKVNTSTPEAPGGSTAGESGSDIATAEETPSELSAGHDEAIIRVARQNVGEVAMLIETPDNELGRAGRRSLVAELEGSLPPVFLPSTVYTPISASRLVSNPHELEAPNIHFNLPPRPKAVHEDNGSVSELSGDESQHTGTISNVPASAVTEANQIHIQLEEAVRRSMSDDDIQALDKHDKKDDTYLDVQKTPKAQQGYRVSAKIEGVADLIDQPTFTPPGSPTKERPESVLSRHSAMVEERRITTIHRSPTIGEANITSPEEAVTVADRSHNSDSELERRATTIHSPDEQNNEPTFSPITVMPTFKCPELPFTLKVVTKLDEEEDMTKSQTPVSNELEGSDTQDLRQHWQAFFKGQLKSPSIISAKSHKSNNSTSSTAPKTPSSASVAPIEPASPSMEDQSESITLVNGATRPSLANFQQQSSPTLGFNDIRVGSEPGLAQPSVSRDDESEAIGDQIEPVNSVVETTDTEPVQTIDETEQAQSAPEDDLTGDAEPVETGKVHEQNEFIDEVAPAEEISSTHRSSAPEEDEFADTAELDQDMRSMNESILGKKLECSEDAETVEVTSPMDKVKDNEGADHVEKYETDNKARSSGESIPIMFTTFDENISAPGLNASVELPTIDEKPVLSQNIQSIIEPKTPKSTLKKTEDDKEDRSIMHIYGY